MLCGEGIQHGKLQVYRSAHLLPSSRLANSSPAAPKLRSHLASCAVICLEETLNREANPLKRTNEDGGCGGHCGTESGAAGCLWEEADGHEFGVW